MRRCGFAAFLAILLGLPSGSAAQPLNPPSPWGWGAPTHDWHWGELLYGKTYPTKLVIENACDRTEEVTITVNNLPYLALPPSVSVPPGKLEVDATITTPPPPVIPPQPFPPPHGIWTQVNGLVRIVHPFTMPPDCFNAEKLYWATGHIHYDPNPPPPPPLQVPPCAAYWKLGRKPPPALHCEDQERELAIDLLEGLLSSVVDVNRGPWAWLPTPEQIRRMSEAELLALKQRIDKQLAGQNSAGLEGPCAAYWWGGPMPALNCGDALRQFAADYRNLLAQFARANPEAWSWLPTDTEIGAMSEAELIAFKQAGDRQLGFDPTPPPELQSAGACAAFWDGGPMPALNCQEALQALALEYLRDLLGPLAESSPESWSWLPSAEEIDAMSEMELLAFKQQAEGQLVEDPQPTDATALCGDYWSGGPPPAMDCGDEFKELAIDYRKKILDPLAEAYPDQWSWLPTDEEIGAMSEDQLAAFRLRAMKQLGT